MIQLLVIICLIFSLVVGFYGLIILQQLRKKFPNEYLTSFFYYQILTLLFGIYGIIGNLFIREILPKFGLQNIVIETISLFFPLIGLPFIIAGWFMLIKMVTEICNKKPSQIIAILYFFMTTSALLLYGFYVLNLPDLEAHLYALVRKNIFLGFGLVEIVVVGYLTGYLFIHSIGHKNVVTRIFLSRFAGILAAVTLLRDLALYFSGLHFTIGLYYILFYFAGSIPLIFLAKNYLDKSVKSDVAADTAIFEKYKITPREKEIIIEICKGKTNQQIADSLFITLQTVKDHTHNIFQKTEVKNRVQLAQKFSDLS